MAPNLTAVAQLHIEDGLWHEAAEALRIVEPRRRLFGRRREGLYILLEPVGSFPDPAGVCKSVAALVEETYFRGRGSITARLWEAARAANRQLFEANLEAPTERRGVLGLTCAVLRDGELYLLQIGPGLMYLVTEGQIERFPASSPWLRARRSLALDARQAAALGWRRDVDPDLFYAQVAPGDLIVLTTTDLVRVATEREILKALVYQDAENAIENLGHLAGDHALSAIVVEILDEQTAAERPARGVITPRQPSPMEEAERDRRLDLVGPAPTPDVEEEEPKLTWMEEEGEKGAWQAPLPLGERREPGGPSIADLAKGVLGKLGQGALAVGREMLPEEAKVKPRPRRVTITRRRDARWPQIRLLLAAVLVLLAVVALLFYNRLHQQRVEQERLATLMQRAREYLAAAETGTTIEQRATLGKAEEQVAEVLKARPDDADAQALRKEIRDRLDVVDQVSRILFLPRLIAFEEAGAGLPDRLVQSGLNLYTLVRSTSHVWGYRLETVSGILRGVTPEAIFPPAIGLGEGASREVIDIACVPAGLERDSGKLLILAGDGVIWERAAGGGDLVPRPLNNTGAWMSPKAIETYYDPPYLYLYILDTQANLVRKYQAYPGGYTDAPPDYPLPDETVNLRDGMDLAIDGNIYILLRTGKIVKLFQGKAVDFPLDGLDKPLRSPVAIAVSQARDTEKGSVFVADAGNQRIVEFDKRGRFLRQFLMAEDLPPLDDLRDLTVDGGAGRILLLNGPALYLMNLPLEGL